MGLASLVDTYESERSPWTSEVITHNCKLFISPFLLAHCKVLLFYLREPLPFTLQTDRDAVIVKLGLVVAERALFHIG
jgi:hypothetical protein